MRLRPTVQNYLPTQNRHPTSRPSHGRRSPPFLFYLVFLVQVVADRWLILRYTSIRIATMFDIHLYSFCQNLGGRSPLNVLSTISAHCPFRHAASFRRRRIGISKLRITRSPIIYGSASMPLKFDVNRHLKGMVGILQTISAAIFSLISLVNRSTGTCGYWNLHMWITLQLVPFESR